MPTTIHIETNIHLPIAKVWEYYTKPEHIINWNFASPDWCCPRASNNMIEGGKYSARMEAKDGSWGFDFVGTYNSIRYLHSFSYTIEDGRLVNVKFIQQGEVTTLSIYFEAENENPVELQQQGWLAILNNFKRYAEALG